ncbi:MAG: hypothetical protein KIT84_04395 [Labilithrix sp.]|nr:hypothetical protein [Labilithrix sp.]MCW5810226.1 hypothetical protein [Labilithrix sp.]
MFRSSSLLLSVLGLTLAASTFACSGSSEGAGLDTSKLAVQKKKDGKPTGDGKTCSWGNDAPVVPADPPNTVSPSPGGGGSSGGCATDEDGNYRCWSYDADGEPTPIPSGSSTSSGWSSSGGSSTSSGGSSGGGSSTSSGWSSSGGGSTTSSSGSNGGGSSGWSSSGGSSGGCATDEQGNYRCWSYPSDPPPAPEPRPTPAPSPTYQLGDWFPSIDGCNRCTCTDIGIMCTVKTCEAPVEPPPPSKGCEHDGKWYSAGDSVPLDRCNTCTCGADGYIACTEMACADPPSR